MFYLHDEPHCLRFALIHSLDANELRDLEGCWQTAESIRRGKPLIVDIRRLTSIDEQTRLVLRKLQDGGAKIVDEPGHNPQHRKNAGNRQASASSILAGLRHFLVPRSTAKRATDSGPARF